MAGTGNKKADSGGKLSLKAMAEKAKAEVQIKTAVDNVQNPSHARQKQAAPKEEKAFLKRRASASGGQQDPTKAASKKFFVNKTIKNVRLPEINTDKFSEAVEKLSFFSDKFLPFRLIIASAIFIFVLIIRRMPAYAVIPLLILAALLAGFDLLPTFISRVTQKKYSDPSVPLVLSVFIGFCVGFPVESSATVILYRIGLLLISYTTEKTAQSALELIDPDSDDIIREYSAVADDPYSDHLRLGSEALKFAGTIFKIAFIVAVLYAVLLPLISHFSLRVSLHRAATIILIANPLSVIAAISPVGRVGLGSAASKGFIFRSADLMEDIASPQTIVFDNDLLEVSEGLNVAAVKTESVDKDTFLNLLYNLVYNSKQYFAEVIRKTYNYEYIPQIITDFNEIEGFGVEARINSVPVYFGTAGFIKSRGIFTPELFREDKNDYFLALGSKCVGEVIFTETVQEQNLNYSTIIEGVHSQSTAKCFIITSESEERASSLAQKFGFDAGLSAYSNYEKEKAVKNITSSLKGCCVYITPVASDEHSAASIDIRPGTQLNNEDAIVFPGFMSNFADIINTGRNVTKISRQNVVFALAVKALLVFLSLIGYCNLWFAVYIDMAAALATILNAIRASKQ